MGRFGLQLPGALVAAVLLIGCDQIPDDLEACPPEIPDCDTDGWVDTDGGWTDTDGGTDTGTDTDGGDTDGGSDVEICDGVDNDGDGMTDEDFDADQDGTGDCLDVEECDGVDNDGDCQIDEDCQDCDEGEDDSSWNEAIVNGYVSIVADAPESIVITNNSSVDIHLDEQSVHTSPDTQAAILDPDVIAAGITLEPGDSLKLYYASYTTDNGNIDLYLGEMAWWCIESGQSVTVGAEYEHFGETLPEVFEELVNADNDVDGDGVEDHVDWAGPFGVQTQYSIWDAEMDYAILTIGKLAAVDAGQVDVTLTARNLGYYAGNGTVTDTIPAGWSVSDISPAPASMTTDGDGNTVLTWDVSVDGFTAVNGSGSTLDAETMTYTLTNDTEMDVVYTELAPAMIEYFDTVTDRTGWSMKAWIRAYDHDNDGTIDCTE